jgi:hypothetical protein
MRTFKKSRHTAIGAILLGPSLITLAVILPSAAGTSPGSPGDNEPADHVELTYAERRRVASRVGDSLAC